MNITTVLTVSRPKFLNRVLGSLHKQGIDDLLVIYDGPKEGENKVRSAVSSFPARFHVSRNDSMKHTIMERRINIANNHNQATELIDTETDWVFSVEDDGVLPDHALDRLKEVAKRGNVGMVTGVELGRWGVGYIGAWDADDIDNPSVLKSKSRGEGVESIDAAGLYCALIDASGYKSHTFTSENGLGPDVNLGLHLRRLGKDNYIDWGVNITHLTEKMGKTLEIPADGEYSIVELHKQPGMWNARRLT